jgi:hypothetical protein
MTALAFQILVSIFTLLQYKVTNTDQKQHMAPIRQKANSKKTIHLIYWVYCGLFDPTCSCIMMKLERGICLKYFPQSD